MDLYPPFLDVYGLVYLLAVGQAIFLGLVLFFSRNTRQRRASVIMGIIVLLLAIDLGLEFLFYSRYILEYPFFTHFLNSFSYVIPPLLLLYVLDITQIQQRFKWYDLLYLLPFVYHHWSKWPAYMRSNASKIRSMLGYYKELGEVPSNALLQHRINNLLSLDYMVSKAFPIAFIVVSVFVLERHLKKVKNYHSSLNNVDFKGVRIVMRVQLLLMFISLTISILSHISSQPQDFFQLIQALILSVFIYVVAFFELSRPKVVIQTINVESGNGMDKYQSSNLTDENANDYLKILKEYVEENRAYENASLSLGQLSKDLNINTKYLSQVINERLGVNFYDFINKYRIEEAKKRLANPEYDNLTIEAIGSEVGFNSKNVFYRTFKKFCDRTPKEYKDTIRSND